MSAIRRLGSIAALLAVLAAAQTAQACEVWRDDIGRLRTNCKLSLAKKDYVLNVTVLEGRPTFQLARPNLLPRKNKATLFMGVELYVDVRNDGALVSGATEVAIMADIVDPLGVRAATSHNFVAAVPAIAIGATTRIYLGTLTLPNSNQDWDLSILSVVDPPTTTSPVNGRVLESNEMDNALHRLCRIYGPNPDTTGPEACD